jgi:hypothetical protein
VEERGKEMRVADGYRKLDQDVVVSETALLKAVVVSDLSYELCRPHLPLSCELSLLVCRHERG